MQDVKETQLPNSKAPSHLSISQKISCVSAFALGIAVVGTTAGFSLGNHYQEQAWQQEKDAMEEVRLLNRLQTISLQTKAHQQEFIALVDKPKIWQEEYRQFLKHTTEFKQLWSEFKLSEGYTKNAEIREMDAELEAVEKLLKTYENFPEAYVNEAEKLLKNIDLSQLKKEEVQAVRNLLLNFTSSDLSFTFERFLDDLNPLIGFAYEEYEQAKVDEIAAEAIRVKVIATSIILSVVIAMLLTFFTNRMITRPLNTLTTVAQKVTEESNFDLKAPVMTADEVGILATSLNELIQKVKQLMAEQKAEAERQLIQSEKMSSLGRMLAGVAHEINNPVNFIYGNLLHANEYADQLIQMLDSYSAEIPEPPLAIVEQAEDIELEFLKEDLPKLLQSMKMGADRVRQIVLSLKNFSRLDESEAHSVDIHGCIDSTLLILNNRLKKEISVTRNYGQIPTIEGYSGLLYQVFMNILSNAIDAVEENISNSNNQEITITTERLDKDWVVIRIQDTGSGITLENQPKIFDTFFTTKPLGIGTGLGLAISHQIVVEKHGGQITCTSIPGEGTEFTLTLPIKHSNPTISSPLLSPLTHV